MLEWRISSSFALIEISIEMNSKLAGNSKTQSWEEIWDDKFSCFSADEDENAKALTLNTTNQLNLFNLVIIVLNIFQSIH